MKRYLVLENGTVFAGEAFGADCDVIAEIVFNTVITGYVELLTNTSYKGQAVCQTFPLSGNYGVCLEDAQSDTIEVSALIVRECSEIPSNFRSEISLDDYMKKHGVPGLKGIDTRALTKILRDNGTMNGAIVSDPAKVDMDALKAYKITAPAAECSVKEASVVNPEGKYRIALLDFGRSGTIAQCLAERDCQVHILPWNTAAAQILALDPDGLLLSNGPGDPADNGEAVETVKALLDEAIPTMGIGLGHQILALANGFATEKIPAGHRGSQPVRNEVSGQLYITPQNHGYAVKNDSVNAEIAKPYFTNVNDGTCEGLLYVDAPAFSVQFHPESCGGPKETFYLYDQFMEMVKGE